MDVPACCGGSIALLCFLLDLGEGPRAERLQGRRAGGGIAHTSFSEAHVTDRLGLRRSCRPEGEAA